MLQPEFGAQPRLTSDAETALYRIAQECLTNIAKHSSASTVVICFAEEKQQQVFYVRDNGVGFDPEASTSGLGLIGIKERVKMLGGTISIDSCKGHGSTVKVCLPEVGAHDI